MALNIISLERALTKAERLMPFLRKHVEELAQDPTPVHRAQVRGTLEQMERHFDLILGSVA